MSIDPLLKNDWHVVARSEQLTETKPLRARLLGQDLVLWKSDEGIHAWQDLCIHRGARLSLGKVTKNLLQCPYHGWTYNREGACVHIPAHPEQVPPKKACVKTFRTMERYGWVWASLGGPLHDLPDYPDAENQMFRMIHCGPYLCNAAGPRVVENILDVGHFPFIHGGVLGEETRPEIADYQVEVGSDGVTIPRIDMWQPDPDGLGGGKMVHYTYRIARPLSVQFTKDMEERRISFFFSVTPRDEMSSEIWMSFAMNFGFEIEEQVLRDFQDQIVLQDVPIVESQHPELLPLDLQAELHLRSDKAAIAYRRWLNDIGLTFGTS